MLLGVSLLVFGLNESFPQQWEEVQGLFWPMAIANYSLFLSIFVLFAAFAISYAADCGVRLGRLKWVYLAYALAFLGVGLADATAQALVDPALWRFRGLMELTTYPLYAVSLAYMIAGWRHSDPVNRQRSSFMLLAFALVVLSQALTEVVTRTLHVAYWTESPLELLSSVLAGVVAPALFAYAILRHRVLDLGFAANRTLVYSIVSGLLLVLFGLVEWTVDHLAPVAGREKNAVIDATIALGVFLTFHRVRDAVEHTVSRLFFRRWQIAEQALRNFVREAAFITQRADLVAATESALSVFGEGAAVTVYQAGGSGYVAAGGETLGANWPILVSLRARPRTIEASDGPLSGALVAPMVNRNEVTGVAVVGPKPSGQAWRPDEIELIGWAVRQIGLDLHALEVSRLEADLARVQAQLEGFQRLAAPSAA